MSATRRALEAALRRRVFPGAALGLWLRGEPRLLLTAGQLSYEADAPRVSLETRYDLASLTKPLASASLIARGVEAGRLSLNDPVRDHLPDLPAAVPDFSLAEALGHRSGAPACVSLAPAERLRRGPFCQSPEARRACVYKALPGLTWSRVGGAVLYSDVGFLILGLVLEAVFGCGLEEAFMNEVAGPLSLETVGFGPVSSSLAAPTERRPWEGEDGAGLRGAVHDENAAVLGGVAGHAGLFADLEGLGALGRAWIGEGFLSAGLRRRMSLAGLGGRALGWDSNRGAAGPCLGPEFEAGYFGHNGFTGTSLWLHAGGAVIALLSNRTWPRRPADSTAIHAARRRIYAALAQDFPELRSP